LSPCQGLRSFFVKRWSFTLPRAKASAVLEKLVRQPEKTFSTVSAKGGLMQRSKLRCYSITHRRVWAARAVIGGRELNGTCRTEVTFTI
jgi:hypothetical protein